MISGRDFVIVSDNWGGPGHGLPTSAIHLFSRLACDNRVFWFNTVSRMPGMTPGDARRVARTLWTWVNGSGRRIPPPVSAQTPSTGVRVSNPFMVPWFKPSVRRFNCGRLMREYERLRDLHKINDPVFVTTVPYGADFFRAAGCGTKVYYCVDEFLDYPGVNRKDWASMEADLLGVVDGLVVTSHDLERKRTNGCPMIRLPHGVDFDHFHGALTRAERVIRMESLARPVVGFFGMITEWVDQQVIARLSEAFPGVSFVLFGRADVGLEPIAGRPNVHYLGTVPYADLPRHARYFDVGIIPFVLNNLTRAVNPLKLMEYFALGLPVLATRLPELEGVKGPLRLALTADEFRSGLAEILAGGPGLSSADAVAAARENTWDSRVEQLGDFIEGLVSSKASSCTGRGDSR